MVKSYSSSLGGYALHGSLYSYLVIWKTSSINSLPDFILNKMETRKFSGNFFLINRAIFAFRMEGQVELNVKGDQGTFGF